MATIMRNKLRTALTGFLGGMGDIYAYLCCWVQATD